MATGSDSVLITGGGIVGLASAWYLQSRGFDVTLIDKGSIAQACSRGNCGIIGRSHVLPLTVPGAVSKALRSLLNPAAPFRVKPQLRLSLITWSWQFARRCNERDMLAAASALNAIIEASVDEFRRLFAETALAAGAHASGLLYLFRDAHELDEFADNTVRVTDSFGLSAQRLGGEDVQSIEPAARPDLAGGFYFPDDSILRPEALAASWAALARDAGVNIVEHCELHDVTIRSGKIVSVECTGRTLRANRYVFALGSWSRRLGDRLGCTIPVEPGKGYSMTMTRSGNGPKVPVVFEERQVAATPFDDGYRLGSMMEFVGFDTSIPPFRLQQLQDAERDYLQQPGGVEVTDTWYGWRPMTWDSLPIIGRVPNVTNAILATGHNMLGVTLAPATGRLVAEIVAETPTHIDATPFSPARFS